MIANASAHSAHFTREIFRSLLPLNRTSTTSTSPSPSPSTPTPTPTPTPSPSPGPPPPVTAPPLLLPTPQPATTTAPRLLTSPPRKNTVRSIENDQNNRREKYDGSRWRLVCFADNNQCNNVVYNRDLCLKHYNIQRVSEPPKKKRKLLLHQFSLPTTTIGKLSLTTDEN